MTQVIINDILPYTQIVANEGQTVFSTDWTANYYTDVVVYYTPVGTPPNDVTQILAQSAYNVAFIGDQLIVQVTLVTPAVNTGDIVTITRMTPADRENLYTNTNFTPSMLNNDFGILTMVDQQAQLVNQLIGPRYNYSALITDVVDTILPILGENETWVKNSTNTAITTYLLPINGVAPADSSYVLLTPDSALPDSFALSTLQTGLLVNSLSGNTLLTTTLLGTTNQINIVNGNGLGGNIVFSITPNPIIPGTAGMGIPIGTTAQRIIPLSNISLRYNTTLGVLEYYNGAWVTLNASNQVQPGLINQLAWYAASGASVSGLSTADNGVLVTSASGVPSISSTLPIAVQDNITALGTIESIGAPLGIAFGGTGVDAVTTVPTPLAFAGWDTNKNFSAVSFISGYSTTANSGGTTVLTVGSNQSQYFTGTANQTVEMPVTSTLTLGQFWYIVNNSTGVITIQSSGGNTILELQANSETAVTCISTSGTTAASWVTSPVVSGSGTVNNGTINDLAWYAASGTAVSALTAIDSAILTTSTAGVPTWLTTITAGLALLSGAPAKFSNLPPITKINPIIITSSGNYTPSVGTIGAFVFSLGAGAQAGGISGTGANGSGAGGGAGNLVLSYLTIAQLGVAAIPVTIGAQGAGAGAGANGNNGGNTTFAASIGSIIANGGSGGTAVIAGATGPVTLGGTGGVAATSLAGLTLLNIPGQTGGNGIPFLGGAFVPGSIGGSTMFGAGAPGAAASGGAVNGIASTGNGSGGSGAVINGNGTAAGGPGSEGLCFVLELIST